MLIFNILDLFHNFWLQIYIKIPNNGSVGIKKLSVQALVCAKRLHVVCIKAIRDDRYVHPRRPSQTYVSTVADARIGRYEWFYKAIFTDFSVPPCCNFTTNTPLPSCLRSSVSPLTARCLA